MTAFDQSAANRLKIFVERVERINAEIDALNDDKKEFYSEARSVGFDVKVLKKIVADRRRLEKDEAGVREASEIYDIYVQALHGVGVRVDPELPVGTGVAIKPRVRAHEEPEPFDPETGEVVETSAAPASLPPKLAYSGASTAYFDPGFVPDMPDIPPELDRRGKLTAAE